MRGAAAALLFAYLGLFALPAAAHVGGFTYEAVFDEYFIDIGANKLELLQDELILFEYNLYPVNGPGGLADFDHVFVTVSDERQVVFAGTAYRPSESLTVLSFAFPKAGIYQMTARFGKGGEVLAEAAFPMEIKPAGATAGKVAAWVGASLVAGCGLFWTMHKLNGKGKTA